jgi:hypothetical protein
MLDAFYLKKVTMNMNIMKVAKCKQSSILTSIQNTCTNLIKLLIAKKQQTKKWFS